MAESENGFRLSRSWELAGRYVLHAKLLWRASPMLSLACVCLSVVQAAAATAVMVTSGRLVESLSSHSSPAVWWWLSGTGAAFVVGPVAGAVAGVVGRVIATRYLVMVFDLTVDAGVTPPSLAHLEDPDTAGTFDGVAEVLGNWLVVTGIEGTWGVLGLRLGGIGAFVVLASWRWWAPLVAVFGWGVMSRASTRYIGSIWDTSLDLAGSEKRRASYLRSVLVGAPAAKEIRLFDLSGWLVDQYTRAWRTSMAAIWRRRRAKFQRALSTAGVGLATTGLVFGFLASDTWNREVSAGDIVTLVQAILGLAAFGSLDDSQTFLARATSTVARVVNLRRDLGLAPLQASPTMAAIPQRPDARPLDDDRGPARRGEVSATPAPRMGPGGGKATAQWAAAIDVSDVSFTYPAQHRPTLEHLNLFVPAGQSVGIVGLNGVGKSTLIKLLCGLYPPDRGSVRIDGRDPSTDEEVRRRVAVIFQEFIHYPMTLRENVGLGGPGRTDDRAVEQALRMAGAERLLAELPDGLDTLLSPEFEGGRDLSGGQWQLVALARAFAALDAGAGVLVLDEPMAALDVRVEAELFERFLELRRGVTTILVSHRLSSVRQANRIVVVAGDGGSARVVEDGTHEELLARQDSAYAHLFRLQASRFAATVDGRPEDRVAR